MAAVSLWALGHPPHDLRVGLRVRIQRDHFAMEVMIRHRNVCLGADPQPTANPLVFAEPRGG
jgi:hypothetical protein